MNFLKGHSFGGMDFQWRESNLRFYFIVICVLQVNKYIILWVYNDMRVELTL